MRLFFLIICLGFHFGLFGQDLVTAKKAVKLMGCGFELTVTAENDTLAWAAIEQGIAEINRIEKLISSWDQASQTSKINRSAGLAPVTVDQELYNLIYRSKKVSKLTDGAFDISFASMDRIWDFNKQEQKMPSKQTIVDASAKINWEGITLDPDKRSIFLQDVGMKIGFGGIGKGYAANRAQKVMRVMDGVKGGLVNASGDITAWGINPKGEYWKIQIADPKNKAIPLGSISLKNKAIVTSGDYEKYFLSGGKRYAHIVNPKTGYPTTGIKSVSVICPDAELADALATSIFVLGTKEGLKLINQLNQIECIIVTDTDTLLTSDHLQLNYQQ